MFIIFIQKLNFRSLSGGLRPQTPWTPFLEFLPSLLDSMATVFSFFVSVFKQNPSPNTKKSLGGLPPLTPPHRELCPLDPCWGSAPDPVPLPSKKNLWPTPKKKK